MLSFDFLDRKTEHKFMKDEIGLHITCMYMRASAFKSWPTKTPI